MDISDLLGGNGGSTSLNEDLAAANPAGDMVFSSPFGAATAFRTPNGGALRVAFVFDPHAPYDETAILASIHQEYLDEMREALAQQLLTQEELAPREPTMEEVVWETIKKALPPKVLATNYFSDPKKLEEYLGLIRKRAEAAFREETLLGERLRTESFRFQFKIAIDAFFNKNVAGSHERKGVLTFAIDGGSYALNILRKTSIVGCPQSDLNPESSSSNTAPSSSAAASAAPAKASGTPDKSPKAHRRVDQLAAPETRSRSASQLKREDMKEVAALLEKLHIQDDQLEATDIKCEKDFPQTTEDFFDSISRWFRTVITTRGQMIEHKNDTNPLYQ
eukprot:m.84196 g.84196  ORF g.84196 m.84196 type:complete len:335 (-) comp15008_c0_seq1:303-1307(-)